MERARSIRRADLERLAMVAATGDMRARKRHRGDTPTQAISCLRASGRLWCVEYRLEYSTGQVEMVDSAASMRVLTV